MQNMCFHLKVTHFVKDDRPVAFRVLFSLIWAWASEHPRLPKGWKAQSPWKDAAFFSEHAFKYFKKKGSKISVKCIYGFKNIVTVSESNFSKISLGYIWEAFIEDFEQNCVFDSFKL